MRKHFMRVYVVPYFTRLKSVLKPGGRVVVIDYELSKLGFFRKLFGHATSEKIIVDEMRLAGYDREKSYTILKQHSFNVFVPE